MRYANVDAMEATSNGFLEHVVSNGTQYTDGWRKVCQELLDSRAENEKLRAALHAIINAECCGCSVYGNIACEALGVLRPE